MSDAAPSAADAADVARRFEPRAGDALLVIDVQRDFCAGGALEVPDGDAVVAVANALMPRFEAVVLTQDFHPAGHSSFASEHPGRAPYETVSMAYGEQTLWPDHCVIGTAGADFHPALDTRHAQVVVRKGFRRAVDSYSAFRENDRATTTGLAGWLRERGVRRTVLVGLALDFCVAYSARDARREGFEALVLEGGCRGIDLGGSVEAARREMREAGVELAA